MKRANWNTASSRATTPPTEALPADPIFGAVARFQEESGQAWGHVLDAGTGHTSLSWLVTQPTARWTAVTGESGRAEALEKIGLRPQDRLLVGNWRDPAFLAGERFDVVLADYLLGAVERYAPYFQFTLLKKLGAMTRHRLYLVGMEPYPQPLCPGEQAVLDVANFRDACHLHIGERFHREFPLDWTLERLQEYGFSIKGVERFPIIYGKQFIQAELGLSQKLIGRIPSDSLRKALQTRLGEIRKSAESTLAQAGGLRGGFDYLIAAEPAK